MKLIIHLLFSLLIVSPLFLNAQCLDSSGIGSFEATNPLNDWFTADEGNGSFQVETTEVYTGSNALKVDVTTYSSWQVRMFNNAACYFDIVAGETYNVSFNLKGTSGSEVSITLMDNLTNDVVENITLSSNNWESYTIPMTVVNSSAEGRLKFNFKSADTYYIDDITIKRDVNNWYVSPSGTNNISGGNGTTSATPLQTIQYAVNTAWEPGDTILVMNGTYQNAGYGSGSLSNNPVVNLQGTTGEETGWLVIKNHDGHSPKIQFDGAGGIIGNGQTYLEISGFEIEGPNQSIVYADAFANRLIQDKYYSGRGIAIWSGHHITIHNNKIHDCPNSGIRVNNGDYCTITDNEVYNNTWWSSNAESAIVFATALDIDTESIIKMVITNNLVYDNYNNIPYYNSTYTGETSDYGTAAQDYIIDGSGCYITRNRDTYLHGWFYFANNVSYGNGINGLVVHKSDRTIVSNNTCFMNGAVPLSSGRQQSSGITIHGSDYVRMYNNISWARFDNDFGYQVFDWDNTTFLEASNNILAKGRSAYTASQYTFTDPLFVDTLNKDFRLQAGSPAIDAGINHANMPSVDFDYTPIGTPDIGAFEFVVAPLPIELSYFEAIPTNKQSVLLQWKTMTETNNQYFVLERSINGKDWEELKKVTGAGNSNRPLTYYEHDIKPHIGLSYYRLGQVDFDGAMSYSDVKSVVFRGVDNSIVVYPNPATNQITIKGEELDLEGFELYNILGQNVSGLVKISERDLGSLSLDISGLLKGVYVLKVGEKMVKVEKL